MEYQSRGSKRIPDPIIGPIYHYYHGYWWQVIFRDGIEQKSRGEEAEEKK